jgi:His/Glu/Gln/Arg/opine family amino acid ABC transporter permease subunit
VISILAELSRGAATTLSVAFGAWFLATVLGLALAIVRQNQSMFIQGPLDFLVTVLRSIPQLVILYLIFFGLSGFGLNIGSIPAAIVGLGVTDAAFTAEYYRAGFLTVTERQREAGLSLGLSRFQVLRLIVLPQTIPFMIPPLLNSFVGLLKTATIAAAVGAPEILYRAQSIITRTGDIAAVAFTVVVLYVIVTLPLTNLVGVLEARARAHGRRAA